MVFSMNQKLNIMTHQDNTIKYGGHSDVEPPDLRHEGAPPLRIILRRVLIGVAIALIIVISFSLFFYLSDRH